MRTTTITVYNNKKLEIFVENRKRHFEVWLVGPVSGLQTLLDHHLTHDDLEAHLGYARPHDLVWRDAPHSEIPIKKHQNAVEMEKTIQSGTYWDYTSSPHDELEHFRQVLGIPAGTQMSCRLLSGHLGSIAVLDTDKKETRADHRSILGSWTDRVLTLNLEPDHKLSWSCTERQNTHNIGERVHNCAPDWWNFAKRRLYLMNIEYKRGLHMGVLRVNEQELHVYSAHSHLIAHIFYRI